MAQEAFIDGNQINNSRPLAVEQQGAVTATVTGSVAVPAVATGGATIYKNIDVDESEDQVSAVACTLYTLHAMNMKATVLYLKLYDALAANVTVGTTVPDMTFPLPTPGSTNGQGFCLSFGTQGAAFTTALTIACTTGVADNDTGAPGANECIVNLTYK